MEVNNQGHNSDFIMEVKGPQSGISFRFYNGGEGPQLGTSFRFYNGSEGTQSGTSFRLMKVKEPQSGT